LYMNHNTHLSVFNFNLLSITSLLPSTVYTFLHS
jgi:hypothetical protein